jgi:NDP-sugar pyrophosphorylase family protein
MRAVILADRLGRKLLPLTDGTCVALLPVAGKPVIEHTMDYLAAGGIKQATVILAAHADQVRALLGDGRRWGMSLDFGLSRGEEEPDAVLNRISGGPSDCVLLVRGDMLRGGKLQDLLNRAAETAGVGGHACSGGKPAGIALCRGEAMDLAPLHWPNLVAGAAIPADAMLDSGEAPVYALDSLADFHRANLNAVAGEIPGLLIPGRETALGLTQGRNSRVSPRSLKVGAAFVGNGCRVDASAELRGVVVLADYVIVDRQARLSDTVVLPHTYVGELVDLRNAIVRGNDLMRIDTGAQLRITDAFLLADLQAASLGGTLMAPLHRLGACLLLLLSLPLWPMAVLAAKLQGQDGLLRKTRLRGNRIVLDEFGQRQRAEFSAYEWTTAIPVLRHLPRLFAVITGDLRLVGAEPVTPEQAERRILDWEKLADNAPAGLLGPTQLRLDADAPEEERLMSDAFYAAHRKSTGDGVWLWEGFRALFSRTAWRSGD